MFDWAEGVIEDATDLAQLFVLFLCIVIVITIMYRTRAVVPVLGAALLAGIAIFVTSDTGLTWLSDIITEETSGESASMLLGRVRWPADALLATVASPPGSPAVDLVAIAATAVAA